MMERVRKDMLISAYTSQLARENIKKDFPSSAERASAFYKAWKGPQNQVEKDILKAFQEATGYFGDIVHDFANINSVESRGFGVHWALGENGVGSFLGTDYFLVKSNCPGQPVYEITSEGLKVVQE